MGLKSLLRSLFYSFLSLGGLKWFFPGFQVNGDWGELLLAAVVLTAINLLVKPVLKLILLPFNLISFGLFRWVINVLSLLILAFLVDQVRFAAWHFPGFSYAGITLPAINFSALGSLIVSSFLLTFIRRAIGWVLKNGD
ncbi:hypothetical protein A2160_01600 [Candidatus Beckwithbacteria bacterium RBG_13_42_9]|uniref:Phage holin family protein n=1 Tax=Candidatus Beckwithbacteria bacterium RBG_13_42_9 TaxID=1797457 RepID=A0A1F5E9A9_9BACT|nr:MAG: hypothetical protein A2160_01600 [Candidatus Beckwithbacteria bacterium RBG_13_42_9]